MTLSGAVTRDRRGPMPYPSDLESNAKLDAAL